MKTALPEKGKSRFIWQGYERASLAVQKANYAVKMYTDLGFQIFKENDEEYIMVCEL